MAYLEKLKSGKWRAQIRRKSLPAISKTFERKIDAVAWSQDVESKLRAGKYRVDDGITVEQVLEAYMDAKTEGHEKKKRSDIIRINRFIRELPFMPLKASELVAEHINAWIKRRGQDGVEPSSIRREYTILRAALRYGAHRLDAPIDLDLFKKVDVPPHNPPRRRNVAKEEIDKLWDMCPSPIGRTASSYIPAVFEWCCETAMRKGEALALKHSDIFEEDGFMWAELHTSKTGHGRSVPMSPRAVEIYRMLPTGGEYLFKIASGTLDTLFRRYVREAGFEDLRFHDSRHQATLAMSKKLGPMQLAKVTGHRSLTTLLTVYYQPSAADLARELATPRDA